MPELAVTIVLPNGGARTQDVLGDAHDQRIRRGELAHARLERAAAERAEPPPQLRA